jgi:hypothetical protein
VEDERGGEGAYDGLAVLDVLLAEEELPVEVREVDGVQVEESDVPKAGEHQILH